ALPERPTRHAATRFLLMARMDDWKGIDDLLAACVRVKEDGNDFHVTLAGPPGTAGDNTTLPKKIDSMGLTNHVRYVGSVHGEDKAALLLNSDVYLQPSHHEGMPMAILEAMAHGLPVLATRVGAVPEVVMEGTTGWLVPAHHPAALADAMKRATELPTLCRAMGTSAYKLARTRFGIDRFYDDLRKLYRSLGNSGNMRATDGRRDHGDDLDSRRPLERSGVG
ncbi:MAG: glycosyltransferase family 4 protein, partial [Phycisphaerae bacterium]